jgi:hypothetical protein
MLKNAVLTVIVSAALAVMSASFAQALTLGLPSFKTAPASISITNQFSPDGEPTPSYTLSVTTTIASAQGAPGLVGQSLVFYYFFNGGFDDGTVTSTLSIGGTDLGLQTDAGNSFLISPPLAVPQVLDPVFTYAGIFEGFGPNAGAFPEINLLFELSQSVPTLHGYRYCFDSCTKFEFSNIGGLTEISGIPVVLDSDLGLYPEGTIRDAVLTFSTVNGRPTVSAVPLPTSVILFMSALVALAGVTQLKRFRHLAHEKM